MASTFLGGVLIKQPRGRKEHRSELGGGRGISVLCDITKGCSPEMLVLAHTRFLISTTRPRHPRCRAHSSEEVLFTPPPLLTRLNSGHYDHLCLDYMGPWQAQRGLVKVAGFIVIDCRGDEGKALWHWVKTFENEKQKPGSCWRARGFKLLQKRKKKNIICLCLQTGAAA